MKKNKYKRAELPELQFAFKMKEEGKGVREIARLLKRSPGTISKWFNKYLYENKRVWLKLSSDEKAWHVYSQLRLKCNVLRKRTPIREVEIRNYVIKRLKAGDSPEYISFSMAKDVEGKQVCVKTIYNLTKYSRGLKKYLAESGKPRSQKVKTRRRKVKEGAPKVVSIHSRSEKANNREEFGHFEGDLIIGKKAGSSFAILSIIERLSRHKWFRLIPDTKSKTVLAYIRAIFDGLPSEGLKSLTLDNGPEFAYSQMIKLETIFTGLETFYCDAYKSFQKGAIERANRDFRRFYPKGTDFGLINQIDVRRAQKAINLKPMKLHDFLTPQDIFNLHIDSINNKNKIIIC